MKRTLIIAVVAVAGVAGPLWYFQRSAACEAGLRSDLAAQVARADEAEANLQGLLRVRAELEENLNARNIELENAVARADLLQRQGQHAKRELRRMAAELEQNRELLASLQAEVQRLQQELLSRETTAPLVTDYERQRYESEILQLRSRLDAPEDRRSYSSGQTFSAPLTVRVLSVSPAQDVVAFTRESVENMRIDDRFLLARGDEFVAAVQVTQLRPNFAVAVVVSTHGNSGTIASGDTLTILRL